MKTCANDETTCQGYRQRWQQLSAELRSDDDRHRAINARIRRIEIQIADKRAELARPSRPSPPPLPGPRPMFGRRPRPGSDKKPRPTDLLDFLPPLADQLNDHLRKRDIQDQIRRLGEQLRQARAESGPIYRRRNQTIALRARVVQEARAAGCRAI